MRLTPRGPHYEGKAPEPPPDAGFYSLVHKSFYSFYRTDRGLYSQCARTQKFGHGLI